MPTIPAIDKILEDSNNPLYSVCARIMRNTEPAASEEVSISQEEWTPAPEGSSGASDFSSKITVSVEPREDVDKNGAQAQPTGYMQAEHNVRGVLQPVITLNGIIILDKQEQIIKSVEIDCTGKYPVGRVVISDPSGNYYQNYPVGVNNYMIITITPPHSKAYRKIKIHAYIEDAIHSGANTTYYWRWRLSNMEQQKTCTYPYDTTYGFFKAIATAYGMGFAVSDKVETVKDFHYRVRSAETLMQMLERQCRFAGTNEDEIMDWWVDPWNFINLVNIKHQCSDIDQNNKLVMDSGTSGTNMDLQTEVEVTETYAFITNINQKRDSNNHIKSYKRIADNFQISREGNSFVYKVMNARGDAGGHNAMDTFDLQVSGTDPDSLDPTACEFRKEKFLGVEQDAIPVLKQTVIHDNFMKKFQGSKLEVEMTRPNYGFIKGQQLYVNIVENEPMRRATAAQKPSDILDQNLDPTPDVSLCGIYIITGMKYEYLRGLDFLKQTLQLVKITYSPNNGQIRPVFDESGGAPKYIVESGIRLDSAIVDEDTTLPENPEEQPEPDAENNTF